MSATPCGRCNGVSYGGGLCTNCRLEVTKQKAEAERSELVSSKLDKIIVLLQNILTLSMERMHNENTTNHN